MSSRNANYDRNRRMVHRIMKEYNLETHRKLTEFLLHPNNVPYLQSYLIICSGYMNIKEVIPRLDDLMAEVKFVESGYTYRDLFNLDPDWSDYFKENAYPYPSGQRRSNNDLRRGVDREYVDYIMDIKRGPPPLCLDDAIVKACQLKFEAAAELN